MRRFRSMEEVGAAHLPQGQHEAVADAVGTLERIFGPGFDMECGFVVLVEESDTLGDAVPLAGHTLGDKLEIAWRRYGCLFGLTLWGNSGYGVTWVCPERPGYAPQVQERLRREL